MKVSKNNRGFKAGEFIDLYGEECSVQKSSLATQDAIWLGVSNPKLTIFDANRSKYLITDMPSNFSINSRMHLNREQVAELLPILQRFVETGEVE